MICQICQTKKVMAPVENCTDFSNLGGQQPYHRGKTCQARQLIFFFKSFEVGGEGSGGGHPYVLYIYIYNLIYIIYIGYHLLEKLNIESGND